MIKGSPLRLNLASGNRPRGDGWINVDMFAANADLRLDLREPLPFPDESAEQIYCEHFFEHLEYPNLWDAMGTELEPNGLKSEALSFLRECRRVLVPGGTLDIIVPDAGRKLRQYHPQNEGGFPMSDAWWGPKWANTPMHRINYLFRQGREHKYAYDEETLVPIIESVGFVSVRRRCYDPASDAPDHDVGSLCVVARKPEAVAHRSQLIAQTSTASLTTAPTLPPSKTEATTMDKGLKDLKDLKEDERKKPSDAEDDEMRSMHGGSNAGKSKHSGSRDVTEGPSGGTGTETGGTRNYRSGTGATGGDIGNRPE